MTRAYNTATTQQNSGGAVAGVTAGKNGVINGGFDIWQRGTSVSVASTVFGYTADRWLTNQQSAITVSRQSVSDTTNLPNILYCARYQRNSGQTSTTVVQLAQPFENINSTPFVGKTVTLSFYARKGADFSASGSILNAVLYTGTGFDQNLLSSYTGAATPLVSANTLTTTWQRFTVTGTVSASATEVAPYFYYTPTGTAGTNDYYEITGVQLEVGSVATPFSRNSGTIAGELAACQRYYQAFPSLTQDGYALFGSGYAASTTKGYFCLRLNGSMRTSPTMSYSAGNTFAVHTGASTVVAGTAIATDRATAETVWFNITVASGLTAGNGVLGIGNNTTSAKMEASSEL